MHPRQLPAMKKIAVGVDPPGGATECGIVAVGVDDDDEGYTLEDWSVQGSPNEWGRGAAELYTESKPRYW